MKFSKNVLVIFTFCFCFIICLFVYSCGVSFHYTGDTDDRVLLGFLATDEALWLCWFRSPLSISSKESLEDFVPEGVIERLSIGDAGMN